MWKYTMKIYNSAPPCRKTAGKVIKILFIFCLLPGSIAIAQEQPEITAAAAFDKSDITIGEKVTYTIGVEAPQDTKIDIPVIDPLITGAGFAIKDFGGGKPVKIGKNRLRKKQWYLLDTYITGAYRISPIIINYTLSDGTGGSTETTETFLEVRSVINEGETTEDIRDIKLPVIIPVSYRKLMVWSIIIFTLIIITAAGFLFYFKYRRFIIPQPPPLPPYVIALRELKKIRDMDLATEENIKKYYIGVSGIIRHYIEQRFSLHAPEQTTEEFLSALTAFTVLDRPQKTLLRDFLKHCDMVKFARYGPDREEIDGVYNTATKFVHETQPAVKPAAETG